MMSCFQLLDSLSGTRRQQLSSISCFAVTQLNRQLLPCRTGCGTSYRSSWFSISSGFQKLQQNQLQSCDAVAPVAAQASASTGFPVSAAAARQFTAPTSFLVKFLSIFLFLQQQLFGLTSGLCRDIKSTANMCSAHIFG